MKLYIYMEAGALPSPSVLTVVFLLRYMSSLDCLPLWLNLQDMSPQSSLLVYLRGEDTQSIPSVTNDSNRHLFIFYFLGEKHHSLNEKHNSQR